MTRRAAIAALAVAFAAFAQARGEWVTEVVTNRVEYDGVEWIYNNGYAGGFITDVYGNGDTRIEVKATTSSDKITLVGCDDGSTGRNGVALQKWTNWLLGYNNGYAMSSNTSTLNQSVMVADANRLYINGSLICSSTYASFVYAYPIAIFGINRNGSLIDATGKNIQIYYVNVRSAISGNADIHPVVDNGVAKMFNKNRGVIYNNNTTNAFTYGAVTGKVAYVSVTTNRVYRAPAPMRSYDAQHPFNAPTARTRLGGTGSGEDGTTLRPSAHFDIKRNEED